MCRLVAYIGDPISPVQLVFGGSHSLYEQSWAPRELLSGSVNADGYGIAWYANDDPARIAETRPIWYDDDLPSTLRAIQSRCVVAALRNGTTGIPVDRSGLLPLVHGRWTFALNGFVPDFRKAHMRALREDLPDHLYSELRGSSDSETLFLLTVAEMEGGATPREALTATAQRVKRCVGTEEAQLNMVLSDGHTVSAVRSSTVLRSNSLYVAERSPFAPDGVVLASEAPEAGASWAAVDGHSWIEIDESGTIRTDQLFL
jgi:predicted glutamine amidotransferase